MPLLLGNGTKISKYLINHDKEYEVILELGKKTTTADIEGEIIEERIVNKNLLNNVENILKEFIGKQKQVPPMYSAIKVNGKKLYDYARKGQTIEVEARQIEIYNIKLNKIDFENNQVYFYVKCSKGTYIRSLCEDIATRLGTVGYMKELNRISVGNFNIKDSIKISEFEKCALNNDFSKVISIEELFKEKPSINLINEDFNKFINGVKISTSNSIYNGVCKVYLEDKFIGLGILENSRLKRDVIM